MKYSDFLNNRYLPGLLLFISGIIIIMGIITAESYYPAVYSTAENEISDLGATHSSSNAIYQPSASIFNTSMVVAGLLISGASAGLSIQKYRKVFTAPLIMFGIGVLGVGLFPSGTAPHSFFATLTFITGGLAAIISSKVIKGPFRVISILLGTVALVFLFFSSLFIPYLGKGGTERWVAYPITLWLIGYGGYLLSFRGETK